MTAKLLTSVLIGVSARRIEVEVDVGDGLPHFEIVGLAGRAVKESKDRVRAAIKNERFVFPDRRVTVNLAPASLHKEGATFDLAIALGLLVADGQVPPQRGRGLLVVGELALDGHLKPMKGALPIALDAHGAGIPALLLPASNAREAALGGVDSVFGPRTLAEAVGFLRGETALEPWQADPAELLAECATRVDLDFAEVRGQASAKRALEVAAAGGHNVLLIGPPGSGKTMLARRLSTILPDLSFAEALECTTVHSVAGLLGECPLLATRPVRAPHHTSTSVALLGGGNPIRPGEMALAHRGVLFLDELPEFPVRTLEALRQPLEEGSIVVSRATGTCTFPADTLLVCAMNPCGSVAFLPRF